MATVYPLVYWHAHLPRHFWWFLEGDFVRLPLLVERIVAPLYWGSLGLYAARSIVRGFRDGWFNPGKDMVVATTAVCWYAGIVAFNSDYAFTVTNVIIYGVPYLVLVYWHGGRRKLDEAAQAELGRSATVAASSRLRNVGWRRVVGYLAVLWLLAYGEELLWDRALWHERDWLFGGPWDVGGFKSVLVPLLAVPQITHYLLDGFLWRRRSNPGVARWVRASPVTADLRTINGPSGAV